VDCPDPPGDFIARLQAAIDRPVQPRCAYACISDGPQPLFALYRVGSEAGDWLVSAQSALERHGSVTRWHAELGAVAVGFDADAPAFHNLNTPEDFAEYERAHGGA
jgi:molybdopterin-guanine dinucleotide biosynthesis protein A